MAGGFTVAEGLTVGGPYLRGLLPGAVIMAGSYTRGPKRHFVSAGGQNDAMGEHGETGRAGDGAAAQERFEVLIEELLGVPGVTPPRAARASGRSALRVDNKIFAMLARGHLVLRLPASASTPYCRRGRRA